MKKRTVKSVFCFLRHISKDLIQALTCSKTEREEQRRRGRERRAPDESTKLRVRCDFLHQRNEWHNEATPLNVRAPSVSLPVGLCRMAEGGNT